ncbi:MAG: DUF1232 domain-containing protein [Anaerolineae bacterium]|jgi:uncharacterized membrane protein YkvA (DUF1232 family)|nr:DUF1232 domain-containing protein [Anaerolineae bacterium]MBT7988272.1 DUF1232 domain-containing protein [Anaerolineae bacterium]
MANQNNSKKISSIDGNILQDLILRAKLITRLMGDNRVNGLYKLLPWVSIIYLISPIDLISGALVPVLGAVDDVAIMWFGLASFIELCPPHVVEEHLSALTGEAPSDVVDAEIIDD